MSGLPRPELHKDAKFVFLSDWDGTITDRDSNDLLIDTLGMGPDNRRALNAKVVTGEGNFRDAFSAMLGSIKVPFAQCTETLRQNIRLDPGFEEFYYWCKAHGVPVIIVSSGMAPNIRAVLSHLMGEEEASKIEIIANDVRFTDPAGKGDEWEIVWRHPESGFGHDKSQSIIPYRELPNRPTIFFAGDGVSDLSAARHADLLFTKVAPGVDSDLLKYCKREGIPHVRFATFKEILEDVKKVVEGQATTQEIIAAAEKEEAKN